MNFLLGMMARWSRRSVYDTHHYFQLPQHAHPNYVSSLADQQDSHYVNSIKTRFTINEIITIMTSQQYTLLKRSNNELHFSVSVGRHNFIDDVKFRLSGSTLHIISSSRVGYSDMGENRKRVDNLRFLLET